MCLTSTLLYLIFSPLVKCTYLDQYFFQIVCFNHVSGQYFALYIGRSSSRHKLFNSPMNICTFVREGWVENAWHDIYVLEKGFFSLKMVSQFDLPGLWSGVMNKQECCAPGAVAQQETELLVRTLYIPSPYLSWRTAVTWLQHRPLKAEREITLTETLWFSIHSLMMLYSKTQNNIPHHTQLTAGIVLHVWFHRKAISHKNKATNCAERASVSDSSVYDTAVWEHQCPVGITANETLKKIKKKGEDANFQQMEKMCTQ